MWCSRCDWDDSPPTTVPIVPPIVQTNSSMLEIAVVQVSLPLMLFPVLKGQRTFEIQRNCQNCGKDGWMGALCLSRSPLCPVVPFYLWPSPGSHLHLCSDDVHGLLWSPGVVTESNGWIGTPEIHGPTTLRWFKKHLDDSDRITVIHFPLIKLTH